jgi:PAS domain S-box-containing protein
VVEVYDSVAASHASLEADTIIANAPDPVFVSDLEGKILQANDAVSQLLGFRQDEVLEQSLSRFISLEETREFTAALREVVERGVMRNVVLNPRSASGEIIPMSLNASALRDPDGRAIGVIGILHDMREIDKARAYAESLIKHAPLRWLMAPSQQLERLVQQIGQAADSRLPILIEGETGTGKELVARTIHQVSARRERPFIAIACSAKSGTAIEGELFGGERQQGRFQLAEGGSLFFDEIVSLPLLTQSQVVRAIQEGQVRPLGSKTPVHVDVRVMAASSVPFELAVRAGLNGFVITLPPLRERDDILHLARDFVTEASMDFGRPCHAISAAAAQGLLRHSWPGNVRELRNVMRRATLLASDVIEHEHLSLLDGSRGSTPRTGLTAIGPSLKEIAEAAAEDAERQAIRQALQACKGNKTEAARRLRTDYKTLHLKIKQHGIDAGRFKKPSSVVTPSRR